MITGMIITVSMNELPGNPNNWVNRCKEKALRWLYELPAEQNQLTKNWQLHKVANNTALDSQALIELTNHYCLNRRCLDCAVGNRILKKQVL